MAVNDSSPMAVNGSFRIAVNGAFRMAVNEPARLSRTTVNAGGVERPLRGGHDPGSSQPHGRGAIVFSNRHVQG